MTEINLIVADAANRRSYLFHTYFDHVHAQTRSYFIVKLHNFVYIKLDERVHLVYKRKST